MGITQPSTIIFGLRRIIWLGLLLMPTLINFTVGSRFIFVDIDPPCRVTATVVYLPGPLPEYEHRDAGDDAAQETQQAR